MESLGGGSEAWKRYLYYRLQTWSKKANKNPTVHSIRRRHSLKFHFEAIRRLLFIRIFFLIGGGEFSVFLRSFRLWKFTWKSTQVEQNNVIRMSFLTIEKNSCFNLIHSPCRYVVLINYWLRSDRSLPIRWSRLGKRHRPVCECLLHSAGKAATGYFDIWQHYIRSWFIRLFDMSVIQLTFSSNPLKLVC